MAAALEILLVHKRGSTQASFAAEMLPSAGCWRTAQVGSCQPVADLVIAEGVPECSPPTPPAIAPLQALVGSVECSNRTQKSLAVTVLMMAEEDDVECPDQTL